VALRPEIWTPSGEEALVERVGRRLQARGVTVATAESCTGGMLGEMLTRLPGSSRCFIGGAIVYTNAEKTRQLGVLPATLAAHGAVSEEVVRAMASGARERFGVDVALAISGIAGPDGGTPQKPVGTVWLARASAGSVVATKIQCAGTRDDVRHQASCKGLEMIDEVLDG
jgi:PncC family amidohydrolase